MRDEQLVEKLHFVGGSGASQEPWVCYKLLGEVLCDFPDNGKPVMKEVVGAIREKFGVGLTDAIVIWRNRRIEI